MKQSFCLLFFLWAIVACNSNSDTTATTDSTNINRDTVTKVASAPLDTATTLTNESANMAKEGTMMMKDHKMMIMKNGSWEEMKETMTCTDGCKVMTNGDVKMKDHTMKLKEGEMIDKDGHMMDKDGKMMDMK